MWHCAVRFLSRILLPTSKVVVVQWAPEGENGNQAGAGSMSDMSASGRESRRRHLWVGGLPDEIDEAGIQEYFSK